MCSYKYYKLKLIIIFSFQGLLIIILIKIEGMPLTLISKSVCEGKGSDQL